MWSGLHLNSHNRSMFGIICSLQDARPLGNNGCYKTYLTLARGGDNDWLGLLLQVWRLTRVRFLSRLWLLTRMGCRRCTDDFHLDFPKVIRIMVSKETFEPLGACSYRGCLAAPSEFFLCIGLRIPSTVNPRIGLPMLDRFLCN